MGFLSEDLFRSLKLSEDSEGRLYRDGRRVDVRQHGHNQLDEVSAFLDPPLDLGLRVYHGVFAAGRSIADEWNEVGGSFWVDADEADRARTVFRRTLLGKLRALAQHGTLQVTDGELRVTRSTKLSDLLELKNWHGPALATACRAAEELDRWRKGATPPAALALQEPGWKELARKAKGRLERAPLRLSGRLGKVSIQAWTWRTDEARHAFVIRLATDDSLNLDLGIAREDRGRKITRPFRWGRRADRTVGDARFDEVFDVRTSNPRVLAQIVDADVRAEILACLPAADAFRVHDRGLELDGRCDPADAAGVPALVRHGCAAIERMHANLSRGPSDERGPYR